MKVYVLVYTYDYEETRVVDVYATRAAADNVIAKTKLSLFEYYDVEEHEVME